MIRALIVDDEPLALECAKSIIDWQEAGVSQVYTAKNAQQAKSFLRQCPCELLLCDIEMPNDNGLDLIQWIRQQDISIEVILLTAHVNFDYAKRAVGLGCLGYLLKPIDPEELRTSLSNAIQIITQKQNYARYRENSARWLQNKPVLTELFWKVLSESASVLPEQSLAALQAKYSTDYALDEPVVSALFHIFSNDVPCAEDQVRHEINAALFPLCREVIILSSAPGLLLVFCVGAGPQSTLCQFREQCQGVLSLCQTMHGTSLAVYLTDPCPLPMIPDALCHLHALDRENIWKFQGVFTSDQQDMLTTESALPNPQLWITLMMDNDYRPFFDELDRYYARLRQNSNQGAAFLTQLHHDFLQIVYFVLYTKGIQIHSAFADGQLLEKNPEDLGNVEALFQWMRTIALQTHKVLLENTDSKSLTDQVLSYIDHHLNQALSREELAKLLHVSPDHLTRIVKRATGMTLSEYIQQHRVSMAMELLRCTNRKISDIALSVGCPHFSQFSQMFKKYTGMTPQEFRARQQESLP